LSDALADIRKGFGVIHGEHVSSSRWITPAAPVADLDANPIELVQRLS